MFLFWEVGCWIYELVDQIEWTSSVQVVEILPPQSLKYIGNVKCEGTFQAAGLKEDSSDDDTSVKKNYTSQAKLKSMVVKVSS